MTMKITNYRQAMEVLSELADVNHAAKALQEFFAEPVRAVADVSGGLLHGTYCGQPLQLLYIADEDVGADLELVTRNGADVGARLHETCEAEEEDDEDFVEHLFAQLP